MTDSLKGRGVAHECTEELSVYRSIKSQGKGGKNPAAAHVLQGRQREGTFIFHFPSFYSEYLPTVENRLKWLLLPTVHFRVFAYN